MTDDKSRYEEFKISGDELLTKVRELIHEGNVRRVFLKNEEGATILEIPLTAGLAVTLLTAAFSPVLVAVGAIAALLAQVTVGVERPASDQAAAESGTVPDESGTGSGEGGTASAAQTGAPGETGGAPGETGGAPDKTGGAPDGPAAGRPDAF